MGQPIPDPAVQSIRFDGLTVDLEGRTLHDAEGRELALTRSEFDLLAAFLRAPGRALSRDYLLDAVSGRKRDRFDRSIDMLVGRGPNLPFDSRRGRAKHRITVSAR